MRRSNRLLLLAVMLALAPAWASDRPDVREQVTATPLEEAYRLVSRQFDACFRVRGIFGNGYEVQSDLDRTAGMARVEIFTIGLNGARPGKYDRVVTLRATGEGTAITTTGRDAKVIERTDRAIAGWLAGRTNCSGK